MKNYSPENSSENSDSKILNYLAEKHQTLNNDYRTPDGEYAESCGLIAAEVAGMLLAEGKKSKIVSIIGKRISNPHINANEMLKPLQYEGRVAWGSHLVCMYADTVYDPMIGRPMPIQEYLSQAFGQEIEMEVVVEEEEIEEFVKR